MIFQKFFPNIIFRTNIAIITESLIDDNFDTYKIINNEHYIKKYIESKSYLLFKYEISCINKTNNLEFIPDLTNQCPIYFNPSNDEHYSFDYCIPNCPQDLPFLLISKAKCVSHCSILEREKHECITNYKDKKGNFDGFDLVIEQIREEVINNFNESTINKKISRENDADIFLIKLNYDETIFNKDYSYKKYYSSNRRDNYLSKNKASIKSLTKRKLDDIDNYYIHLEKCLNILKQEQDSLDIDNLFLLRTDVEQDGMKFPYFYFELYQKKSNNNLNIVSLSQCKDININIDINNAELKENINKYIPSSDYYNDICYTTKSDYNTDIILSRRHHNYVDYNMSVCGLNCEFIIYNTEDNQAVCSCDVKTEIPLLKNLRFDKNILLNSFTKINNIMNVKMLKCYETVFNNKNIIKNIGFYIFLFFIILDIICIILFYYKDYKKILFEIEKVNSEKNFIINTSSNKNKNSKIPTNNHRKKRKRKKKQKLDIIKSLKLSETNKINLIDTSKNEIKEKNSKNENELLNSSQKGIKKNKNKNKLRNKLKKKEYLNYSQLNSLNYEEALNKDKRNYTQYYISLLLTNHSLIYIFYSNDYNSKIIKIVILIFKFSSDITINALFFTDSSMDKIYINHGSYNIIYQIPKIIYSSLISTAFNTIIKFLGLSESDILKIKLEKEKEKDKKEDSVIKVIKNLTIKFLIFFIINFLFQITFWYYVTCFCGVYKNTQIFLFKDSLFSFCVSLITPFAINLLPGVFRICGLKNKKEYVYNISKILQLL